MPSTYSSLKIELPATGEQSGTWGNTTNTNLGTALEEAIVGSADVTFASGNVTLTLTNTNASQVARNLRLNLVGTTGGSTRTLTVPAIEKLYLVSNNCADSVIVGNATGATVTVPAGKNMLVYNDGTDILNGITYFTALTAGSLTLTTALTTANGGTGLSSFTAGDLPYYATGTALSKLAIGTNGYILQSNGTAPTWVAASSVVGGAAGSNTQVQYNNSGALGASSSFTFSGSLLTVPAASLSGNLTFTTTANRILGDFSNSTIANRVLFQTSTTNGNTIATTIPNGTSQTSGFSAYNNSDPTNASLGQLRVTSASVDINSTIVGTGTYVPITFLTGGSERMRVDTSGNVGIGTASPQSLLDVNGMLRISTATPSYPSSGVGLEIYYDNTSDQGRIQSYSRTAGAWKTLILGSADTLFHTGGTERMRIDSGGQVGINTTTPNFPNVDKILAVNGSATSALGLKVADVGAGSLVSGSGFTALGDSRASTVMVFSPSATERMRIDSSGNVGIGTTSPTSRLQTTGTAASSTAPRITFENTTASTGRTWFVGANDGGPLAINDVTANAERMRIDSSGRVLVGTTSSTSVVSGGVIVNPGTISYLNIGHSSGDTGGNSFAVFKINDVQAGDIRSVTSTTVQYNTSSDYRLKENIAPMTGALATVAQLKPVTYTWKADGSDGQGFIAHELQEIVPDAVAGEKDAVDEEGKPVYQGIDTSFLVATLTAAIQEQQVLIEKLTTRLNALEGK